MISRNIFTERFCRRQIFLLALVLTGLLSGCNAGYPTEDVISNQLMSSTDKVRLLNALNEDVSGRVRHEITLIGDCALRFTSKVPRQSRTSVDVQLLTFQTETRVDPESRFITIAIGWSGDADLSAAAMRAVYETSRWHEAAVFRTTLDRLQRLCAESLRADKPAAQLPALP